MNFLRRYRTKASATRGVDTEVLARRKLLFGVALLGGTAAAATALPGKQSPAPPGPVNPTEHGAVGDGIADDSDALQAAFKAGGQVFLPGRYRYTKAIDIPDGVVVSGPGRAFYGSASLIADHPDALIRVGRLAHLKDVIVDGAGVANWGVQLLAVLKPTLSSVLVRNVVDAGFVLDGTQNSVITDCVSVDCKVGWLMLNGAANIEFVGCEDSNMGDVGGFDHRSILITNSSDDRTIGAVRNTGNRDLRWWGGIYEYGSGQHQVEILNGSRYGSFSFNGTQLVASDGPGATIFIGAGYTADVLFSDCALTVAGKGGLVSATAGRVKYHNVSVTGSGGRSMQNLTDLSGTAIASYDFNSSYLINSYFQTGLYAHEQSGSWQRSGAGNAVWDAESKRMRVAVVNADGGARSNWRNAAGYAEPGRVIRIRLLILNSSAEIRLCTQLVAEPWARTIGVYGDGEHEIVHELKGDENGLRFLSADSSPATAEIAYITCEHVV